MKRQFRTEGNYDDYETIWAEWAEYSVKMIMKQLELRLSAV